jgi:hypothetical protein
MFFAVLNGSAKNSRTLPDYMVTSNPIDLGYRLRVERQRAQPAFVAGSTARSSWDR